MSLPHAIELFVAIQTLVIAVSHMAQPRAWVEFFVWLRGKGHAGVFVNGFLSLWFGALIVAFHPVWSGLAMVVTLLGCAQIVKGSVAFILPRVSMRGLARVSLDRRHEFVGAGAALLALSGFCWYLVLAH
jgi:hypothetical protein